MTRKDVIRLKKFRFLEHTADIKFKVWGKTIEKIFENSALALCEFLSKGQPIKDKVKKKFRIVGKTYDELLYKFIDGIVYLMDAENFISANAKVKIKQGKNRMELEAFVYGDKVQNYENLDHIKSATYSEMYIERIPGGWEAQAVVDV
jgi:SHS2 domain-containing protein